LNFRLAVRNANWKLRQTLIWVKNAQVLGRQDYQWKHEPCQPAGTMVCTTGGLVPIEQLKDGDRVISFDSYSGQVKGSKNGGYAIKTASRDYDGQMYYIRVGAATTRATDNHQFSVRFNGNAKKKYCTYLMRRGNWWRVGQTKAYDSRQFGLKTRMHQEKADAVWLISMHEDKIEAQVAEQILAVKYGIPYTIWEQDRFAKCASRSKVQIESIYAALNLSELKKNAERLLHDYGRSERFPFVDKVSQRHRFSTRVTAKINACNLVPGLMQLPIPKEDMGKYPNFTWEEISDVKFLPFKGKVYSLAVEKHEHYIADGIITHNCLYGWKDGAAHYFRDVRTETTVIPDADELDFETMKKEEMKALLYQIYDDGFPKTVMDENKPAKDDDHPTMKPVRLFGRLITNSSRQGEIVLDTFGGSGTTIVACEQLGRKGRLVELDPHYCDVIINRWEQLTGEKATLIRNTKQR
jgi:hypothetical protein